MLADSEQIGFSVTRQSLQFAIMDIIPEYDERLLIDILGFPPANVVAKTSPIDKIDTKRSIKVIKGLLISWPNLFYDVFTHKF